MAQKSSLLTIASFNDLRAIFREDARNAYRHLVDRRPGEHICAFALVTDDHVMGASPAGDTTERREKRLAARMPRTAAERKYHQWEFAWNTGEWDDIYTEQQPGTHSSRTNPMDYVVATATFRKQWTSRPGHSQAQYRCNALRAMIDALADLDSGGLFGMGRQREGITLFVEITDSNDDEAVKLKSARLLNPRRSGRRLTSSLPLSGRVIVHAINIAQWFARGRLIAGRSSP